ncbi:hypothetical protein CRM22_001311 [Opisthorchis felineus]|uniref:CP-type G domain-containing protein n=1 Tax=Opisthorchis felineus TaxID=147828 RepID=A0A4S2MBA7_OPIFE|nr:hypothetical protein CRM22_001311 [Opisthorchis felineus]
MSKKKIKTKSKRVTCHKRYKILRKVREHHRKLRKEAKKNVSHHKRRDPGVPNSLPFKDEILKHVEEIKATSNEVRMFNLINAGKSNEGAASKERHFSSSLYKETENLINECDVILEVLDARDPLGTRGLEIEEKVNAAKKRLVLLLNKIDLIPRANLQLWLNYLRQWYTVLPFKANTQKQSTNLSRGNIPWNIDVSLKSKEQTSKGMGVDELMSLLANYSRSSRDSKENTRMPITVGVIGLPNTGKSAIINTLKRQKVCMSSNVPGLTRQCQRVRLDKNIFLVDSPGIVTCKSSDTAELVLKNCLKPESLPDPIPAVEAILRRCSKHQMMSKYNLGDYADTTAFLVQLAHRLGRLKKGGVPNTTMAARAVISDWITGKLTYCTQPPECPSATSEMDGDIGSSENFENDLPTDITLD